MLIAAFPLNSLTPLYLTDDCQLVVNAGRRHHHSTDTYTCVVPRAQSHFADRSFKAVSLCCFNPKCHVERKVVIPTTTHNRLSTEDSRWLGYQYLMLHCFRCGNRPLRMQTATQSTDARRTVNLHLFHGLQTLFPFFKRTKYIVLTECAPRIIPCIYLLSRGSFLPTEVFYPGSQ